MSIWLLTGLICRFQTINIKDPHCTHFMQLKLCYSGNNTVIHKGMHPDVGALGGLAGKLNNDIKVRLDPIQDVALDSKVYRNNMFDDLFR